MEQAAALMLIAQAAGLHPAIAARVYRIKVLPSPFAIRLSRVAIFESDSNFKRSGE